MWAKSMKVFRGQYMRDIIEYLEQLDCINLRRSNFLYGIDTLKYKAVFYDNVFDDFEYNEETREVIANTNENSIVIYTAIFKE